MIAVSHGDTTISFGKMIYSHSSPYGIVSTKVLLDPTILAIQVRGLYIVTDDIVKAAYFDTNTF